MTIYHLKEILFMELGEQSIEGSFVLKRML